MAKLERVIEKGIGISRCSMSESLLPNHGKYLMHFSVFKAEKIKFSAFKQLAEKAHIYLEK